MSEAEEYLRFPRKLWSVVFCVSAVVGRAMAATVVGGRGRTTALIAQTDII